MKSWFPFLLLLVLSFLVGSCAGPISDKPGRHPLVMRYKDFGPQAAAYELLGYEWPQWESQGSDDPAAASEIGVVVYRDQPLSVVKQMYPVIQGRQDYRYVRYETALEYCDRLLKESGDVLPHLKRTRREIETHLGMGK